MKNNKPTTDLQSNQTIPEHDQALKEALHRIDTESQQTAFSDDFEKRLMERYEATLHNDDDDLHVKTEKEIVSHSFFHVYWNRMRVAAACILLLIISGLAYAVLYQTLLKSSSIPTETVHTNGVSANKGVETDATPIIRFENVRLDSMLSVVAKEYHRVLYFRDDQPRNLRISTTWQPQLPLSVLVNVMNELDGFLLSFTDDTIYVEHKMREDER